MCKFMKSMKDVTLVKPADIPDWQPRVCTKDVIPI